MAYPNVIQNALDEFGKRNRMEKRGGAWYQRGDQLIAVVELQKSNYGARYFVNVAVWFEMIERASFPKENKCQVRTRLDYLVTDSAELGALLNLESPVEDDVRYERLEDLFVRTLEPILRAASSLSALRTPEGRAFLSNSLVTPDARDLIEGSPEP